MGNEQKQVKVACLTKWPNVYGFVAKVKFTQGVYVELKLFPACTKRTSKAAVRTQNCEDGYFCHRYQYRLYFNVFQSYSFYSSLRKCANLKIFLGLKANFQCMILAVISAT